MKKLILGILFLIFFSCEKIDPETEKINKLSDKLFEEYFFKNMDAHKNASEYVDSLANLNNLKNSHKGKVYLWKMVSSMVAKDYDKAFENSEKVYELNQGKETALLVNYYIYLGRIQHLQNKEYQALYYYNKAGEILGQTKIYNTVPKKADLLLLDIAKKNRRLALDESANRYLDLAFVKNRENPNKSLAFDYKFNMGKASIYTSVTKLNKDSVYYYLSKADLSSATLTTDRRREKLYVKSEYFYNARQLDSSLYYFQKFSKGLKVEHLDDQLNLLSIYSRLNKLKEGSEVLQHIKNKLKRGKLNASDSLLYFKNSLDYYVAKKDYPNIKKSLQEHMVFNEKFYNKEIRKNVNELSVVLDLQHKDKEIKKTNTKYLKSVQTRNKIIGLSVFLLLIGVIIVLYFRGKSTKKRLMLEKNEVDLKMKLLQSQINPHFIFNTLASIQSLIRQEKNEESIRYLNKFSGLMRQTLNLNRDEQTTLEKEIQLLKSYVEVQKLRKNNFELIINLNDEVEDLQAEIVMPALSLQPFIENSILHGFKGIDYKGGIVVNITSDEQSLYIKITDNGIGLQQKEKSNQKSHGIDIIKEQFDILGKSHKSKNEFIIENRKDTSGVLVNIKIPLILIS